MYAINKLLASLAKVEPVQLFFELIFTVEQLAQAFQVGLLEQVFGDDDFLVFLEAILPAIFEVVYQLPFSEYQLLEAKLI